MKTLGYARRIHRFSRLTFRGSAIPGLHQPLPKGVRWFRAFVDRLEQFRGFHRSSDIVLANEQFARSASYSLLLPMDLEGGLGAEQEARNEEDAALVVAMARGDRGALAALYDRLTPVLLAVAYRMLRERREAEDLLHDVFLEVWRHAADFDPSRGTVRAWVLVRLRSRALDRKKSVLATRVVSLDADSSLGDSQSINASEVPSTSDHGRLHEVMNALPEEQRAVLELGYFEGLSSSEIAARLGVPVGTVKSRVAAALGKLRSGLHVEEVTS